MVLQRYLEPEFTDKAGFLNCRKTVRQPTPTGLIEQYDVRSGQGPVAPWRAACPAATSRRPSSPARSTRTPSCWSPCSRRAVWTWARLSTSTSSSSPSATPDKAVLLVSLELDEVMNVSDRILVMYEGEIVGELDPKNTTVGGAGPLHGGRKADVRMIGHEKENTSAEQLRLCRRCSRRLVCIVLGLLLGYLVLLLINPDGAGNAYS